jgi:hypothetical protein
MVKNHQLLALDHESRGKGEENNKPTLHHMAMPRCLAARDQQVKPNREKPARNNEPRTTIPTFVLITNHEPHEACQAFLSFFLSFVLLLHPKLDLHRKISISSRNSKGTRFHQPMNFPSRTLLYIRFSQFSGFQGFSSTYFLSFKEILKAVVTQFISHPHPQTPPRTVCTPSPF